jgi:hypothetical protein
MFETMQVPCENHMKFANIIEQKSTAKQALL